MVYVISQNGQPLTHREQEISPPTPISGEMNCDKHGVYLTFVSHSIII